MSEQGTIAGYVIREHVDKLFTDTSTWERVHDSFLIWAAKDPWTFLYYVFQGLSPSFAFSATLLSYNLSKAINKPQEKEVAAEERSEARQQLNFFCSGVA